MNDSFAVRHGQPVCQLQTVFNDFAQRQCTDVHPCAQRLAF